MTTYNFTIEERTKNGTITSHAIEDSTGNDFQVNVASYLTSGDFPEITDYLESQYGTTFNVAYSTASKDSFDQNTYTWVFNRTPDTVLVKDTPRTVYRITMSTL